VGSPEALQREFAPGFRLSVRDVVVLVLGAAAAAYLFTLEPWWGFIVAFVVGHFFLFCNVVRMARPLELTWAAVFLALASATLLAEAPGWPVTAGASLVATLVVVGLQVRKPSYHGVGWRRINPGLRAWWDAHAWR
jgi:hypothetical protein